MRVITGTAKGRALKAVPGETTRPITDRVKEALFDILGANVREARFLDLFAGTGGVGIEALSRGAHEAVFVENGWQAIETIRFNLEKTGLEGSSQHPPYRCVCFPARHAASFRVYLYRAPAIQGAVVGHASGDRRSAGLVG